MRNPFARDLILLHASARYDFRFHPTFLGPVADAVPSTAMFEMYPVGLTSIAAYLERNHYNVEIVNIAYRMLHERSYDVDAHLRAMSAPVFGIDLHGCRTCRARSRWPNASRRCIPTASC